MKQSSKQSKRKAQKPLDTSQPGDSTNQAVTNTPGETIRPVLKEIEVQVFESEFLTDQETSDAFTGLSASVSSDLTQLDSQIQSLGSEDTRTLTGGELTNFLENYASMKSAIEELVGMVKVYSIPLTDRKIVMDQLEVKVRERQALVDQSLQQLQKTTGELQLAQKQQLIDNWEKVFCATAAHNTHGRRWKFLIQPLKTSIKDGVFNFNPEVVLQKARASQGEDIEAILERVSKQSKKSQTNLSAATNSEASSAASIAQLDQEAEQQIVTPLYNDVIKWTHEPDYTRYLVVAMKRPVEYDKFLVSNISVGDSCYTVEFPLQTLTKQTEAQYCMFSIPTPHGEWLQLATEGRNESLKRYRKEDDSVGTLSLNIAIHPESVQNEMDSMLHLPLQSMHTKSTPNEQQGSSNIVFTDTELSIEGIIHGAETVSLESSVTPATQSLNRSVTEVRQVLFNSWGDYPLKALDASSLHTPTSISLSHCWVNVKRDFMLEASTETAPLEAVLSEMAYVSVSESDAQREEAISKLRETHEQELNSIKLEAEQEAATASEEKMEQLDFFKTSNSNFQNEILELASQLKTQQEMYESKLEDLLENLNTTRSTQGVSSSQQTYQLQDKLPQLLDKATSPLTSAFNLDTPASRKKPIVVSYPKPNWEEMVQGSFLERLEVFAEYMIKKQTHLRDKIRAQVSRGIELQLATLHRLAPVNKFQSYYDISDDISLPSLFMPTQCSKHLVYTPRARAYFHPFGSKSTRISQAPTIFKFPHKHSSSMRSVDLYAMSEHTSRVGAWNNPEADEGPDGAFVYYKPETPAPPPSTSMSFRPSTASSIA